MSLQGLDELPQGDDPSAGQEAEQPNKNLGRGQGIAESRMAGDDSHAQPLADRLERVRYVGPMDESRDQPGIENGAVAWQALHAEAYRLRVEQAHVGRYRLA